MTDKFELVDYHIHTTRCGHAAGGIGEYVNQAKTRGLMEIGFADHLPLFHRSMPPWP